MPFQTKQSQKGLGLPTAIFVITIMALLAVAINALVRNNAESTGEELKLIRSFYVAESGLQFGMNAVFPPPASGLASSCPGLGSPTTYSPFDIPGSNNCSVEVTCSEQQVAVSGGPALESFFTIESTGTCDDVSRTFQVRAQ